MSSEQKDIIHYIVFWTCKGTCCKTCDLKPGVVHWIYTLLIRPVLTYGSMIWWLKATKTELKKLQRLACLAIKGPMKMTPTAAVEVLLGLPPSCT
jgi:hypothetical protein